MLKLKDILAPKSKPSFANLILFPRDQYLLEACGDIKILKVKYNLQNILQIPKYIKFHCET